MDKEKAANLRSFAHEYREFYRPTWRARARHLLLELRMATQSLPVPTHSRIHFLYLHHLFRDEEENFTHLLNWLQTIGCQFVSYSEAVQRIINGKIDGQYVCFSFDDGVDSCIRAGQILAERGIAACFFLNTATLGEQHQVHPMLITAKHYGRLPVRYLSWADVEELKKLGHEIGGHTHSHINMATADQSTLAFEIEHNKQLLEQRLGQVEHFAWPFGRFHHFSQAARAAVYAAGYRTCASAERGIHTTQAETEHFCIHRDGLIAAWPMTQIQYLLTQSIVRYAVPVNSWGDLAQFGVEAHA